MKSEWKVSSNLINGERIYSVYRLRDVQAVDHSGNRELLPEETFRIIENIRRAKIDRSNKAEMATLAEIVNTINRMCSKGEIT